MGLFSYGKLIWVAFPKESQLQQLESRDPTLINYKMHAAGSFRISVLHPTLTCTTGFNVRTWSFLCVRVYTRGLGTPTASQHNIFDQKNKLFLCS